MRIETQARQSSHSSLRNNKKVFYQGQKKLFYESIEPDTLVLRYIDEPTQEFTGIGGIQNRLNEVLYTRLNDLGIDHHYIKRLNMWEQLVFLAEPFPFYIQVYNVAVGDWAKRFGLEDGTILHQPIFELVMKRKGLPETVISSDQLIAFDWVDKDDLKETLHQAQRINDFMIGQFLALKMRLATYPIQFGYFLGDSWDPQRLILIDSFDLRQSVMIDLVSGLSLNGVGSFEKSTNCPQTGFHEIARRFHVLTV